jgi:hypothetical protein
MERRDFEKAYGRYVSERRVDDGEATLARRGAIRGGMACSCTCTCLCKVVAPDVGESL